MREQRSLANEENRWIKPRGADCGNVKWGGEGVEKLDLGTERSASLMHHLLTQWKSKCGGFTLILKASMCGKFWECKPQEMFYGDKAFSRDIVGPVGLSSPAYYRIPYLMGNYTLVLFCPYH